MADLINVGGTLYGTTEGGGYAGAGTVFEITTDGTFTVLHSFLGDSDGSSPQAALTYANGTLYGTTNTGGGGGCGGNGCGTVFQISSSGKYTVIYSFQGGYDGKNPAAALTYLNGVLYGTTEGGGAYAGGTVFAINSAGAESVLHSFGAKSDGHGPHAGLIYVDGILYGTTGSGGGGVNPAGTVYSITTSGVENVLHSFEYTKTPKDGVYPLAGLINVNGVLYGTTELGGVNGTGSVFSITLVGKKSIKAKEAVVYSFKGNSYGDGSQPLSDLTYANGLLYGTTEAGGTTDYGPVFQVSISGAESVLSGFDYYPQGAGPIGGVTLLNGTLYGTAIYGGVRNEGGQGTVYALPL